MEIHHTKHHQAYVDNLNKALKGLDALQNLDIEELLKNLDKVPVGKKDLINNNGGGHANHSLFWNIMSPNGGGQPKGDLLKKIQKDFGNVNKMIEEISNAAITQFGSGWGWLVLNVKGKLESVSTKNQDSPLLYNMKPLLGIDVWEHAYYLNYQNKRADYIKAWWNVVNWREVEKRFIQAKS
jgi:Fe-Mn family superoxide dismutase